MPLRLWFTGEGAAAAVVGAAAVEVAAQTHSPGSLPPAAPRVMDINGLDGRDPLTMALMVLAAEVEVPVV